MVISEALQKGCGLLGNRLDVEVLLAHILQKGREYLIAHCEEDMSSQQIDVFVDLLKQRKDGAPVQYLTGRCEFYGLPLKVDERVLIPRPETELLVDLTLERFEGVEAPKILEVGTGSGAIALALAHKMPNAEITASEISSDALEVARDNAQALGFAERIDFVESDLLGKVPSALYDAIIANLPYIGSSSFNLVESSVERFEPHVALFGGEDGLDLYRKMFDQILEKGFETKFIAGEFGFLQCDVIEEVLNNFIVQAGGKWNVEIHDDLAKIPRIFTLTSS
jgi:release factor glutamine methyltransferase